MSQLPSKEDFLNCGTYSVSESFQSEMHHYSHDLNCDYLLLLHKQQFELVTMLHMLPIAKNHTNMWYMEFWKKNKVLVIEENFPVNSIKTVIPFISPKYQYFKFGYNSSGARDWVRFKTILENSKMKFNFVGIIFKNGKFYLHAFDGSKNLLIEQFFCNEGISVYSPKNEYPLPKDDNYIGFSENLGNQIFVYHNPRKQLWVGWKIHEGNQNPEIADFIRNFVESEKKYVYE